MTANSSTTQIHSMGNSVDRESRADQASIAGVDRLRLAAAVIALEIPAALFALNAFISFRERGIVEPLDIPAAIAFGVLAVLVARRSRLALLGGAALIVVFLVTAAAGGIGALVAYWVIALVVALQGLPLTGELKARSAV
jgi:hypothetical protein